MANARRRLVTGFLSVTLILAGAAHPAPGSGDAHEIELQRLRARIDRLQRELNRTTGQRDATRDRLQTLERRINTLAGQLRQTDDRLKDEARALAVLEQRAAREQQARHAQIHALASEIRAAYAAGRQPYLKMLLSQQNPAAAARVLVYYRYFNEARVARIDRAEAALGRLAQLHAQVDKRRRALADLRASEQQERQTLETSRRHRAETLAGLNRQVASGTERLERLRADAQRLERLVHELNAALPEAAVPFPGAKERFASLKGRLPLPVTGRIVARYGQSKGVGRLTWRGIVIAAKEGRTVRAVARGRVAFADWLRGFGLLLILDHGGGYMTLYGYNETLERHTGDWVEAGQSIATVGNTGDAPAAGVYFQIRHNGVPHDPLRWCAAGQASLRRARR